MRFIVRCRQAVDRAAGLVLRLPQKPQKGAARAAIQFLGVERSVVIRIGGAETLLNDGKKFILGERTVMVGIGGG